MYQTQKTPILFFTLITLLIASLAMPLALANPITVSTDKDTYVAGEKLSVTGTATPNAYISVQVFDPNDVRKAVAQTQADEDGAYSASEIYTFTETSVAGVWTVTAYDSAADESASATFIVGELILESITISIAPDKAVYEAEEITITVSGDAPMADVTIKVTQAGAPVSTITSEPSVGDPSKWGGTYMIITGYDGVATINVVAEDAAGNTVTAAETFTVSTAIPVPGLEELEGRVAELESAVASLESDVAAIDISGIESDIASLKSDVSSLKSDIASLESDIATLTSSVDTLTGQVAAARANVMLLYGSLAIAVVAIALAGVSLARKK